MKVFFSFFHFYVHILINKKKAGVKKMKKAISLLQNELLKNDWQDADALITHILKMVDEELTVFEIKELKYLAEVQIRNDIPLKYF